MQPETPERLFCSRSTRSSTSRLQPTEDEGGRWSPDALERVVSDTEGYPYFLQEFGKQAWNTADGPEITVSAVSHSPFRCSTGSSAER